MTQGLRLVAVNCGVCEAVEYRDYATGADFEYRTTSDEFRMVQCQVCGNVYLNPRPSLEDLPVIYPPTYYSYNYADAVHPIAIRAKEWLDLRKVRGWLKYTQNAAPRFLDVGCGDGRYLRMLHRLGVPKDRLYGVELSREPIDRLRSEGYQAFYGRIEDLTDEISSDPFDLIVLLQVIEHVESPQSTMAALAALLGHGGTLVVETPNTESLDVRMFRRRYWGGYHFPRHWNLLNEATLTRLAERNGLRVSEFNYLPAHSFWIFSFHHLLAEQPSWRWAANFFNPLRNVALLSLFTGLDIARATLGFRTSNIQLVAEKV